MGDGGSTIEVIDSAPRQRFEVIVGGNAAGFAQYRRGEGVITFTHTVIYQDFEGRGLGSRLAHDALEAARAEGLTVIPMCPFIAAYMRRHPEFADLIDASFKRS